jgi:hypothetical protein
MSHEMEVAKAATLSRIGACSAHCEGDRRWGKSLVAPVTWTALFSEAISNRAKGEQTLAARNRVVLAFIGVRRIDVRWLG